MSDNRVLAVIPARKGSKGVPGKNIRILGDKPLIGWSIKVALGCPEIDDVLVTTDCSRIQQIASTFGALTPFLRPNELAEDSTSMVPVLRHAVERMETKNSCRYSTIVLLQPTSPLRTVLDISTCLKTLQESDADSVISLVHVDNGHPMKMKQFTTTKPLQFGPINDYQSPPSENCSRQMLPPLYIVNGAVYVTRRDVLIRDHSIKGKKSLGYIMPPERSINIDAELDFKLCEIMLQENLKHKLGGKACSPELLEQTVN